MNKVKITLEDAKAELRDAATGHDSQNWRYSPAVKALLNSHDELLVALGEMKQRAEAAEQRLQQPIPESLIAGVCLTASDIYYENDEDKAQDIINRIRDELQGFKVEGE